MTTNPQTSHGLFRSEAHRLPGSRNRRTRAVTLVEVMISLFILTTVMLGILGTFLQSRKVTESSVLHAAATSVVYGMIEQIKQLNYTRSLPYTGIWADPANGIVAVPNAPDPTDPDATPAPNVRVRINQNIFKWLKVVYTPMLADGTAAAPKGPTTTPAPSATITGIGADGSDAIDNSIGSLSLSTVSGARSQNLDLHLWIWIDEIPDTYVTDAKKITVIYTYSFQDGGKIRTIRDREVILRTGYDK